MRSNFFAFLFVRALHKTEEFYLASNVDGAGAFDDFVFRYSLREPDVWKTCFIQLKHKKSGGTIRVSDMTKTSGNLSLLKYFKSYCEIKNNSDTDHNLKQCGPFVDFEFVIYTNETLEGTFPIQGGETDPLNILSSGTECGKYVSFDENSDKCIFRFFEELSKYDRSITKLDSLLKRRTSVDKEINETIKELENISINKDGIMNLKRLKSTVNTDYVSKRIDELAECDFNLFKEFLNKVKIFHCQSHEKSLNRLIKEELQDACKASPPVANFIYTKLEEGFSELWEKDGNIVWLNKNSELLKAVQEYIVSEINEISQPEIQEFLRCGIHYNQQDAQKLSDAIKPSTFLNIVTNSKNRILQKLGTYEALRNLGSKNSLFIGTKSLKSQRKEILKLWPCKWSDVLVVDGETVGNVAHNVLGVLQQSADCKQGSDISDEIAVETLVAVLQKYQQKLILISPRQEEFRNISYFEDNCDISDLDEESRKQTLGRPVNFQGTSVSLLTLLGTDHAESIKPLIDSDVISILLSNEHELSVGRQLGDHSKYYVPRVLQHHVYLKEDILKLTDYAITFAVSGLQAEELRKYLPAGEKICEFVYDERERNHSLKTVSDFSNSGLSDECGSTRPHQKVGQKMKSDDVMYNNFGNKNRETDVSEVTKVSSFGIAPKFSKSGLSADLEDMTACNEAGQTIKPEEVRYIVFGNKNPDSEFRELKKLFRNVHWIHVEGNYFLWMDTNSNIDIIRRYIDNTECRKYGKEIIMEQSDRTMLLVAEPGMGKSTFLSHMEHEIKKRNSAVWLLRINLNEHTRELKENNFEGECIDMWKEFLWSAAHSPEQDALKVTRKVFLQALEQPGKMVIILDGFDEISPHYSSKVQKLIRAIRDETPSKIWVSSRLSYRQELEDNMGKFALTLQPFTPENQIQFLEQYWSEFTDISYKGKLQMFAKMLLSLCSQNFSDKDGEFTGIPLQTMMLGEAFVNEVKEYCSNGNVNLPEKFNLLSLFKKFWDKKCDIYFSEKNAMDSSKKKAIGDEGILLEIHMTSALISLYSLIEVNGSLREINARDLEQWKKVLQRQRANDLGIITDTTDGTPHFIHRCFAEYFAAKWFTDNFRKCEEIISNILFIPTNEVTRNIFDRMLAEGMELHGCVLNNDIPALEELLKNKTDINALDKGGRTALHLAASYNRPYIQDLLTFPGIDPNKPDAVLKWTPLRYADRTKSWMAMDILLQKGANSDDVVFIRNEAKSQEWGQAALWECASKGHTNLLEFMMNCGIQLNKRVEVPENLDEKRTLLHRASYCGQSEVVRLTVNRGADINIRDANSNTALHLAAESGSVDIIKLLLDKGTSVNMTGTSDFTQLHVSAQYGHLEATKTSVDIDAAINNTNKYGATPLMMAAYKGKLEIFRYLTEIGADINIRDVNNNTALHLAAQSGSVDIIKLLLDKGMSVNVTGRDDSTPLHFSADFGHLEATKTLVEKKAAINNINKYGVTPLMNAAYRGNLEIFRYLTEEGADISILKANKNTALHLASLSGSVDIIKLILDKGISVNVTGINDITPLHVSAEFGRLEATKYLFERGADKNNTNKSGATPLMMAAYRGKLETFRYLTEIGADINICKANNNTALHLAAQSGSVDIIKLLLDKEMSVNVTGRGDSTPLHFSAEFGHLEATKYLFERGAAINNTNKSGKTPPMRAACRGKLETFRYLTEIGADINIRDVNKNRALHLAAQSGSVDIIKLLLDKGMSVNVTGRGDSTPLHFSAEFGHLEATKYLVERGADKNKTNKNVETPLMKAACGGKLETFRYLTEIGADINIPKTENNTALHLAAQSGTVDIIKLLLDKGMPVNVTGINDITPLHVSAEFGRLEATKILLQRGAAKNNTNKNGETPLMRAACRGKLETFRYLTETGADINIRLANNNTVLHLAAQSGCVDIINLLLDKGMSVNLTGTEDCTPLHLSAQFDRLEATKTLVERGAAINNTNKYDATPMMMAEQSGKLKIICYLKEIGV